MSTTVGNMNSTSPLFYSDLERHIRRDKRLTVHLAGHSLELDLSLKHERAYAAKLMLNLRHPQSDLDEFLFKRFVKPGDTVLDAGANIGFTTSQMLSAGASRVIALEPVPELFERLRQLSGGTVVAINKALSSNSGKASLILSQSHNQGSTLNPNTVTLFPSVFAGTSQTIDVELTTIDDIALEHGPLDVWKLDIEGAELAALRGATQTLKNAPPRAIIVELFPPFLEAFLSLATARHSFVYRASIRRDPYELVLVPWETEIGAEFYTASSMYVFTSEEQT
jgi:FkbM family methyltransferase